MHCGYSHGWVSRLHASYSPGLARDTRLRVKYITETTRALKYAATGIEGKLHAFISQAWDKIIVDYFNLASGVSLFMVCVVTVSVFRVEQRQIIGFLVNNEVAGFWEKRSGSNLE